MNGVPLEHGMALAALLFVLGLVGLAVRRNTLFVLMCLEIMLNAAGMAFIVAGTRWGQPDGQSMFILVITLAAADAGYLLRSEPTAVDLLGRCGDPLCG